MGMRILGGRDRDPWCRDAQGRGQSTPGWGWGCSKRAETPWMGMLREGARAPQDGNGDCVAWGGQGTPGQGCSGRAGDPSPVLGPKPHLCLAFSLCVP